MVDNPDVYYKHLADFIGKLKPALSKANKIMKSLFLRAFFVKRNLNLW